MRKKVADCRCEMRRSPELRSWSRRREQHSEPQRLPFSSSGIAVTPQSLTKGAGDRAFQSQQRAPCARCPALLAWRRSRRLPALCSCWRSSAAASRRPWHHDASLDGRELHRPTSRCGAQGYTRASSDAGRVRDGKFGALSERAPPTTDSANRSSACLSSCGAAAAVSPDRIRRAPCRTERREKRRKIHPSTE